MQAKDEVCLSRSQIEELQIANSELEKRLQRELNELRRLARKEREAKAAVR